MKKILFVFGTRPEAIKMCPVVLEFKKNPQHFKVKVCVSGQHREMLDQVLNTFEITPDFDLNIMQKGQDLFEITTYVISGIKEVLNEYVPDIVMVHGDTTTAFATSISSFYKKIKIAHIEAGLRSYNMNSPWPEEMNRQYIDRVSSYCFAPTRDCADNLFNEGVKSIITVTGNTVIDSLFYMVRKIEESKNIQTQCLESLKLAGYNFDYNSGRRILLVTGHRRENFGEGFYNICHALKQIAKANPDLDIIYPVHYNPNVQGPVFEILSSIKNIFLIKPLDYLLFIFLMKESHIVLTDSGGIQEEAPSLGKPVLVMRENTERPEAVTAGTVKLVGLSTITIYNEVQKLLHDENEYKKMSKMHNPYGDGHASVRIAECLK